MALGELDGQVIARLLCLRRQTLHGETAYTKQFTQCHGQTGHRSVQLISKTRSWQPHYAPPLGNIGTEMPAGEGLHRRWLSDLLIVLHPQVLLGTAYCKHAKHLSLRLGQMLLKSYGYHAPLLGTQLPHMP